MEIASKTQFAKQHIWKIAFVLFYTICFFVPVFFTYHPYGYVQMIKSPLFFLLPAFAVPLILFFPFRNHLPYWKVQKSSMYWLIAYCVAMAASILGNFFYLKIGIKAPYTYEQVVAINILKKAVIFAIGVSDIFFIANLKKNGVFYFALMQSYIFLCFFLNFIVVETVPESMAEFIKMTVWIPYSYLTSISLFSVWFLILRRGKYKRTAVK